MMRVVLRNKDGDKRAIKAFLFDNRWLELRPPAREGGKFMTEVSPQEAADLLAGKTIREEDREKGSRFSITLIR